MLSKKTKYAIEALLVMGKHASHKPMLIADIASKGKIPKKFLEQILLELKNNGFLDSKKGLGGGYTLKKQTNQISLGSIIRLFSGTIALVPCVSRSQYAPCEECENVDTCGLRFILAEIRDYTAHMLDTKTLQDVLAESEKRSLLTHMYHI